MCRRCMKGISKHIYNQDYIDVAEDVPQNIYVSDIPGPEAGCSGLVVRGMSLSLYGHKSVLIRDF
ncbi:MAG: hypothetical protein C00003105_01198 [ANME-2 cluster archaeon HR1]|nr:MAG: hypothetical protein C00003105_01198 [ANME-2 cluster archaeon HR1]